MDRYLEGHNKGWNGGYMAGKQEGIKEVVEWIKWDCLPLPQPFEDKGESTGYYVGKKEIEAKLKE